ncbi:MAG: NAD-dependent epimerase/dehydratase family protein, partial [Methylibium sp.]|uniref:NAD-dependent epimerase/dehydratase family protein n=1 Tax=Methylibium sp. TaxID=2067992 RepID=UPI0018403A9C
MSDDGSKREVVMVTGAAGFIGRALVERLAERWRVLALERPGSPDVPHAAATFGVDLASDDSVGAALRRVRAEHGARIASVIHLAAYFDLEGKPHPDYERVTVRGTERLLRELQSFELGQFVFMSTLLVHAPGRRGEPIDEDAPIDPKLPYRESKIKTEMLIRGQRGDIPAVFVRPAGVYDDQGHAAFLAHQIARIHERRPDGRVYPGDPDSGQPFLHLDDLVEALLRIVERRHELPPEVALLLAEPETPTFRELQDAIGCLIHGEHWETVRIAPSVARLGATLEADVFDVDPFVRPWMIDIANDHYEVDISRASRLLGWRPRHSLLEHLPEMIRALKADPSGWYRANKLNPAVVADKAPEVPETSKHGQGHGPGQADMKQHMQQMRDMHFGMLWPHFVNLMLGAWLVGSAFAFGAFDAPAFGEAVLRVTADRGLADPADRMVWLGWSDLVSGALVMLFSLLSLSQQRFRWAPWANTAVGVWLLFAPLVFWSPSAAIYTNDTLIGSLVIAFAILVPMMPGMSMASMMDESDLPVGWSYCPSTYLQRVPIVALGFIGFVISRQLTAYQLGHAEGVWEPFFAGTGGLNATETIITSDVSKALPIADAGLGAVSYVF